MSTPPPRPALADMLANLQKLRAAAPAPSSRPAAPTPRPAIQPKTRTASPPTPTPAPTAMSASLTSSASVVRLLSLLREFAGFRPTPQLERKLEKVFQGMGEAALARWVESLQADASRRELMALVEDLTNHETYFFRDPPQLEVLSRHVLPALVREKQKRGDKTLRLWSAACSTGEEAWTLAMMALTALLDAGIARERRPGDIWLPPDWRLEVMGTDISRQAIRVARDAAYRTESLASFRQFPERYRRFFDDVPAAAGQPAYRHVGPALRPYLRFDLFNLISPAPPCRDQDLVICRNVLIYLDIGMHAQVQRGLRDALRPGGFLMLGVVDRLHLCEDFHDRWFERCVIHERK
ncbi:MAG: CheR family methyltransferase [Moraxellaceae bacterium]|nr:CheR family methyltransferase [Moraxellaceae bacterium]